MVLGAALGLVVLWFTVLRHERIVRRRAARRPGRARPTAGPEGIVALAGIGPAADERSDEDEAAGAGESAQELEPADVDVAADADTGVAAVDAEVDAEVGAEEESDEDGEEAPKLSAEPSAHGRRKLTDEILSRVESELARRETPRWTEMAELVHREFGVSVHPSSIQKAVKRRRQATAQGGSGRRTSASGTTEPAPASA